MKLGITTKQPSEKFSYTVDYGTALTVGDNLQSASVTVLPAGLLVDTISVFDPRVKFWASQGLEGVTYKVTLLVTTEEGRIFEDELLFKIKEI